MCRFTTARLGQHGQYSTDVSEGGGLGDSDRDFDLRSLSSISAHSISPKKNSGVALQFGDTVGGSIESSQLASNTTFLQLPAPLFSSHPRSNRCATALRDARQHLLLLEGSGKRTDGSESIAVGVKQRSRLTNSHDRANLSTPNQDAAVSALTLACVEAPARFREAGGAHTSGQTGTRGIMHLSHEHGMQLPSRDLSIEGADGKTSSPGKPTAGMRYRAMAASAAAAAESEELSTAMMLDLEDEASFFGISSGQGYKTPALPCVTASRQKSTPQKRTHMTERWARSLIFEMFVPFSPPDSEIRLGAGPMIFCHPKRNSPYWKRSSLDSRC